MFDPVIIVIPNTPYKELSPNRSGKSTTWQEKIPFIAAANHEGRMECRKQTGNCPLVPANVPLALHVDVYYAKPGQQKMPDADNAAASFKPYIDGIFKQLGIDDGAVSVFTVRRHRCRSDSERTVYTISYDEGAT